MSGSMDGKDEAVVVGVDNNDSDIQVVPSCSNAANGNKGG